MAEIAVRRLTESVRRLLIPEVAERLRTSERQVLRMIGTGQLRAMNVGLGQRRPRWIVDERDLETFEQARANGPTVRPQARRRKCEIVPDYF